MASNLSIQAAVVDIRTDTPQDTDSFLVDTNVWLWLTYVNASTGAGTSRQVREYPAYLQMCLTKQCRLSVCGLTLAELAHNIERAEREIYNAANGATVNTKEFRHNLPAERANVISEVQAAWAQVQALSDVVSTTVDEAAANRAEALYGTSPVDGYDLFIHEGMTASGLSQVLTDDGDYSTIPGLVVFTSNPHVVREARRQGRLKTR